MARQCRAISEVHRGFERHGVAESRVGNGERLRMQLQARR